MTFGQEIPKVLHRHRTFPLFFLGESTFGPTSRRGLPGLGVAPAEVAAGADELWRV